MSLPQGLTLHLLCWPAASLPPNHLGSPVLWLIPTPADVFRPELFPLHPHPATLCSHLHFCRVDFLVRKTPSTGRQTVVSHSSPLSTRTHSHPHTWMHISMPCFHRSQSSHLTVRVSSSLSPRWKTFSPNLQFFRLGSWFGCGSCILAPAVSPCARLFQGGTDVLLHVCVQQTCSHPAVCAPSGPLPEMPASLTVTFAGRPLPSFHLRLVRAGTLSVWCSSPSPSCWAYKWLNCGQWGSRVGRWEKHF